MKKIICISLLLHLFSCSTSQVEKQITGLWVIDEVIMENTSYPKGRGVLLLNLFRLDENNRCKMPSKLWSNQELMADWELIKKDGDFYLRVENCEEESYNTDFKIIFHSKDKRKVSFVSEKITFNCTQVRMLV